MSNLIIGDNNNVLYTGNNNNIYIIPNTSGITSDNLITSSADSCGVNNFYFFNASPDIIEKYCIDNSCYYSEGSLCVIIHIIDVSLFFLHLLLLIQLMIKMVNVFIYFQYNCIFIQNTIIKL